MRSSRQFRAVGGLLQSGRRRADGLAQQFGRKKALTVCPNQTSITVALSFSDEVPFNWVAADTVYGVGDIEMALRRAGKGYVLGTHATQPYSSWINKPRIAGTAEQIAQDLAPAAWQRLSAGEGTKGPRLFDWAYLELYQGSLIATRGISVFVSRAAARQPGAHTKACQSQESRSASLCISSTPEYRPTVDETGCRVFWSSAERSAFSMVRASPRISWTRGIRSTPDCARGRKVRERAV